MFLLKVFFLLLQVVTVAVYSRADIPPPPEPEPIEIIELPLPPVASAVEGSCTSGTGCILQHAGLVQGGSFLPDGNHVIARVNYTGAPAAPDPASVYTGDQIILVKADGSSFSNGSPFKCITCGVPQDSSQGKTEALDYPQAFRDGRRILAGTNIIDCGEFDLVSDECTPESTFIHPIRWNTAVDGSGEGGSIRELRLHPDNLHIGFNSFTYDAGKLNQYAYTGRLALNSAPTTGLPMAPRYDLTNVNVLSNNDTRNIPLIVDRDQIRINTDAITVGEFRGFSGSGKEATYIGYPRESSNIDVFAVDLATGDVRRLTSHPEYCDPIDISADDEWMAIMDTRGSNRQMFMAGMRNVPPLTDIISTTATSSTRNNGQRRFFQPYLLDHYGDRDDYYGQQVNAAGDGSPGSINDPQWNGMADPRFSLDVTRLVYWQALVVSPACGGENPLPCPNSTEPGGRTERLMVAHFTSRQPVPVTDIEPLSDTISWGTPYEPGTVPSRELFISGGVYTLYGTANGSAQVTIVENGDAIETVAVTYESYSDDGLTFLDGTENITVRNPTVTLNEVDWYSDLTQRGQTNATKKTSPDGFHLSIDVNTNIFNANGTLSTTVNGTLYTQPANGT
ncbi:saponin hydrolase precursor [Hypoxylon rubiginosum]|uniref:Saponin hydrolase n=1 Tax=Hypoxylon rubiginosum TaxID=110542 RepID=A0ACC0CKX3_9PEZI|nr:saponin hydrolase precursor [Hypoxylon rubiginosum]